MKNTKTLKNYVMNSSVDFSELYLCNVMVLSGNLTYLLLKGGEGWGKFETLIKNLCVKCSMILHEKNTFLERR